MKAIVLFVLAVIPTIAFCQTNTLDKKAKKLWVTAKFYPSLTRDVNGSSSHEVNFDHDHRLAFSGGVELTKELVPNKWSITTGILIHDFGYKEKAWSDFIPNYETRYSTRKIRYLTLPFSAQFHLKNFYFGLGVNLSHLINTTTVVNMIPNYTPTASSDVHSWLIGVHGKTGYKHELSDHFSLNFELYAIVTEALMGSFPALIWENSNTGYYSFGAGLGLDYKF
ncbi:MAG: hypothetical protein Crog4KO_13450 [Crocinitomicaceae bacterium]